MTKQFTRIAVVLFFALAVALPAVAQEVLTQDQVQSITYTVVRGDTLWDISGRILGDNFLWKLIYEENRSVIGDNPDLIYPAQAFSIPKNKAANIVMHLKPGAIPEVISPPAQQTASNQNIVSPEPVTPAPIETVTPQTVPQAVAIPDNVEPAGGQTINITAEDVDASIFTAEKGVEKTAGPVESGTVVLSADEPVAQQAGTEAVPLPVAGAGNVSDAYNVENEDDHYDTLDSVKEVSSKIDIVQIIGSEGHRSGKKLITEGRLAIELSGKPEGKIKGARAKKRVLVLNDVVILNIGTANGIEKGTRLAVYRRRTDWLERDSDMRMSWEEKQKGHAKKEKINPEDAPLQIMGVCEVLAVGKTASEARIIDMFNDYMVWGDMVETIDVAALKAKYVENSTKKKNTPVQSAAVPNDDSVPAVEDLDLPSLD